jgi:nucleotide-binding universal stress UspA family protein
LKKFYSTARYEIGKTDYPRFKHLKSMKVCTVVNWRSTIRLFRSLPRLKNKEGKKMYNKILVPLDGSELAECVLPHVENIVSDCGVNEIIFLRVIEPITAAIAGGDYIMGQDESKALLKRHETAAHKYLDQLISSLPYDNVTLSREVITGKAAENIADFATHRAAVLIIMATHGRSGISRWVMGSVAERVIRWSCVPVLIVRPPQCAPTL